MRILHVIPGLTRERGGPSVVVEALARHQSKAGHSVTVLTTDQGRRNGEQPVRLAETVDLRQIKVLGSDRIAYAPGFARVVRAGVRAADVVHVHSIFTYPVHAALREAKAAQVPVFVRPCGQLHRSCLSRSRWRKRAYLAMCGRLIRRACSAWHYTSEQESSGSWPWDSSPRFVLPHGVEPSEFAVDRGAAREAVWRAQPRLNGSPYVLFLGRLHPIKRLDVLLEAFLAGAPGPFKLVVAGPDVLGLWERFASRLLRGARAIERVHRVEMVCGDDKTALLAGATLFALPSEHENFGIAALEALAAGTPVLLSPHVDLAEAAVAADVGYSAPLRVEAWRESLAEILSSNERRERKAERARLWVRENYAWSRIASELSRQYEWVIAGCRSETQIPAAPVAGGPHV